VVFQKRGFGRKYEDPTFNLHERQEMVCDITKDPAKNKIFLSNGAVPFIALGGQSDPSKQDILSADRPKEAGQYSAVVSRFGAWITTTMTDSWRTESRGVWRPPDAMNAGRKWHTRRLSARSIDGTPIITQPYSAFADS
jgi:hypothetical protein